MAMPAVCETASEGPWPGPPCELEIICCFQPLPVRYANQTCCASSLWLGESAYDTTGWATPAKLNSAIRMYVPAPCELACWLGGTASTVGTTNSPRALAPLKAAALQYSRFDLL